MIQVAQTFRRALAVRRHQRHQQTPVAAAGTDPITLTATAGAGGTSAADESRAPSCTWRDLLNIAVRWRQLSEVSMASSLMALCSLVTLTCDVLLLLLHSLSAGSLTIRCSGLICSPPLH